MSFSCLISAAAVAIRHTLLTNPIWINLRATIHFSFMAPQSRHGAHMFPWHFCAWKQTAAYAKHGAKSTRVLQSKEPRELSLLPLWFWEPATVHSSSYSLEGAQAPRLELCDIWIGSQNHQLLNRRIKNGILPLPSLPPLPLFSLSIYWGMDFIIWDMSVCVHVRMSWGNPAMNSQTQTLWSTVIEQWWSILGPPVDLQTKLVAFSFTWGQSMSMACFWTTINSCNIHILLHNSLYNYYCQPGNFNRNYKNASPGY